MAGRIRIVSAVPLLMLGLGAGLVGWTYYAAVTNGSQRVVETMRSEALLASQVSAGIIERDYAAGHLDALRITLTEIRTDRTVRLALLADVRGDILVATDSAVDRRALAVVEPAYDALAAECRRTVRMATRLDGARMITAYPVPLAATGRGLLTIQDGTLIIDRDLRGPLAVAMEDARATTLRSGLLLAALCFAAWGLLHLVLVRRVNRLVQATQALATGNRAAADALAGEDEIGQVAAALSSMAAERDRLEEHVGQAQKMQAIGTLAGGIAHDFNNLLTAIVGYTELAAESAPAGEAAGLIQEIRAAADRGVVLTRQLLTFSRQDLAVPVTVDPVAVVGNTERLLRQLLRADITLRLTCGPGDMTVRLGQGQLEQILMNLAVNARDAMPEGGALDITLRQASGEEPASDGVPHGRWVMLAVRDSGVGMPEQTRARVFEPFFTTKPRGKGTGLGLSSVYWIVTRHHGHVRVTSAPRAGSEFRVYLPEADGVTHANDVASVAAAPAIAAPGGTILLVEDEDAVRRMIAQVLGQHGFRVVVAANAEEALGHWAAQRGDVSLLLTDLVMPGLAGNALAERLRAEAPALRVIYMSGYTDEPDVQSAISDGRVVFLAKPFTPADLVEAVRTEYGKA